MYCPFFLQMFVLPMKMLGTNCFFRLAYKRPHVWTSLRAALNSGSVLSGTTEDIKHGNKHFTVWFGEELFVIVVKCQIIFYANRKNLCKKTYKARYSYHHDLATRLGKIFKKPLIYSDFFISDLITQIAKTIYSRFVPT